MNSVWKEIEKLRSEPLGDIEPFDGNRNTIIVKERNRSYTAYCFSVPIRNRDNNQITSLNYNHVNCRSYHSGSNSLAEINERIELSSAEGNCVITLPGRCIKRTVDKLFWGDPLDNNHSKTEIIPTLNGIAIKAFCGNGMPYQFYLNINRDPFNIINTPKCFSFMISNFSPLVSVSCIGSLSSKMDLTGPCSLDAIPLKPSLYRITVTPTAQQTDYVLIEINMHEPKLMQDTTIDSQRPQESNTFGSISFLGTTDYFGEQWLLTKIDMLALHQLFNRKIHKCLFHVPTFSLDNVKLQASIPSERFCSFASNWDNRTAIERPLTTAEATNGYYHFNISPLIVGPKTTLTPKIAHLVITVEEKYAVVSTGDSYFAPQILEFNYSY